MKNRGFSLWQAEHKFGLREQKPNIKINASKD